ncbi:unnamed protein product [Calypogeia fissa]
MHNKPTANRASLTGFHTLAEFMMALTNADNDGTVLDATRGADSPFKFIMLNASKHVAEVLNDASTVVLAGGTLQPVERFELFCSPTFLKAVSTSLGMDTLSDQRASSPWPYQ